MKLIYHQMKTIATTNLQPKYVSKTNIQVTKIWVLNGSRYIKKPSKTQTNICDFLFYYEYIRNVKVNVEVLKILELEMSCLASPTS